MSFEGIGAAGRGSVSGAEHPVAVVVRAPSRTSVVVALALVLVVVGGVGTAAVGTGYSYRPFSPDAQTSTPAEVPTDLPAQKRAVVKLRAQQKQLAGILQKATPKGLYVVVDQTQNRIYLRKDEQTVFQAVCSAGSGMILKEGPGGKGRKWVFDTPRGLFRVKSKQENPVWKKPDWAFVEEGKPIPKNDDDRMDYGTLGEYSFQLGDGYMIHGTLYERLLGRSVTHGCIRVGRDDLRKLWQMVQVGTPVYIY